MNKKRVGAKRIWSLIVNFAVVVAVVGAVILMSLFGDIDSFGTLSARGFLCLRFFTVDSNILAAVSCLLVFIYELRGKGLPKWVGILKFVGTVAVAVTFLTVLIFLGPKLGYDKMYEGESFFLHLACPVGCLVSFLWLDGVLKISLREAWLGVLPAAIYGVVYALMVLVFQVWPDFYGFNAGGGWYISAVMMGVGAIGVSFGVAWLSKKLKDIIGFHNIF